MPTATPWITEMEQGVSNTGYIYITLQDLQPWLVTEDIIFWHVQVLGPEQQVRWCSQYGNASYATIT